MILAVPPELVPRLREECGAVQVPTFRHSLTEAVLVIGTNATLLVALTLRSDKRVRAITAMLRDLAGQGEITVRGRFGGREVHLVVRRETEEETISDFVREASEPTPAPAPALRRGYGGTRQAAAAKRSGGVEPTRILAVADEWFPRRGGISAFNRYLCAALADASALVTCVVPAFTPEERRDAEDRGVQLVEAPPVPGGTDRERLAREPELPGGREPHVVIGHGRITGAPALALAEGYASRPARLHFVHMQPDQIEWDKLDREDDTATRAEERTREEAELGRGSTRILAVGPFLYRYAVRDLTDDPTTPKPLRFDPGFDGVPAVVPKEGVPLVLMLGRLEDANVKGLDLAARALGHAIAHLGISPDDVELLVRGSPESEGDRLRRSILGWAGVPGLRVAMRNFASDPATVLADVRRSSLVLMPSLEEGFGLVGMEAVAAGVPVLVSDRSGLGVLLQEVLGTEYGRRVVVPVRKDDGDVARWGHEIGAVLRDREAAFATARDVREVMARERPWAGAARQVLAAVHDARPEP